MPSFLDHSFTLHKSELRVDQEILKIMKQGACTFVSCWALFSILSGCYNKYLRWGWGGKHPKMHCPQPWELAGQDQAPADLAPGEAQLLVRASSCLLTPGRAQHAPLGLLRRHQCPPIIPRPTCSQPHVEGGVTQKGGLSTWPPTALQARLQVLNWGLDYDPEHDQNPPCFRRKQACWCRGQGWVTGLCRVCLWH